MAEEKGGTLRRTSDGVPIYDGNAEQFLQYREEAYKYVLSFERHKRYLAGPRLVRELEGVARTVVRRPLAQDPRWVDHPGGVKTLLDYLEANLEKPSLISASRFVHKFFFGLKRKRMETMTAWVNRHSEAMWEANKAMIRVQKEYGAPLKPRRTSMSRSVSHAGKEAYGDDPAESDLPYDEHGRLREEYDEPNTRRRDSGWSADQWSWSGQGYWQWSEWGDEHIPAFDEPQVENFIPDFLVGYLLLNRSGLDYQERNNVLSNVKGEFGVKTVEKALRSLWSDEDIYRRDKAKGHALYAEDEDFGMNDEEGLAADDYPDFGDDQWSEEAYAAAEQQALEAADAIAMHKRTLREARQRQHDLRLGRKFYSSSSSWKGSSKGKGKYQNYYGGKGKGEKTCLKCSGPHSTHDCPRKAASQENNIAEEQAEIAFVHEEIAASHDHHEQALVIMKDLLTQGKGIIDCGATSSLGSVEALEAIQQINLSKKGTTEMEVDTANRPTFRFGNGQRKTCISTAKLKMGLGQKSGSMEVHVHESSNQPILISVKSLKALGAVIDFSSGEAILKHVDSKKVITFDEEANGHLTMDLTQDLLKNAVHRQHNFVSLKDE